MLGYFPAHRFANKHSPSRERREAFFATWYDKKKLSLMTGGRDDSVDTPDAQRSEALLAIRRLQSETQQELDLVLGGIRQFDESKQGNSLFRLEDILKKKEDEVMSMIIGAEEAALGGEAPKWMQTVEQKMGERQDVKERVHKVRADVNAEIDKLRDVHDRLVNITEEDIDPNDTNWKRIFDPGVNADNFRGVYYKANNSVLVNKAFKDKGLAKERAAVVMHERGHAVNVAVKELLGIDVFGDIRREQEEAIDRQEIMTNARKAFHDPEHSLHAEYAGTTRQERMEKLAQRFLKVRFSTAQTPLDDDEQERKLMDTIVRADPSLEGKRAHKAFDVQIVDELLPQEVNTPEDMFKDTTLIQELEDCVQRLRTSNAEPVYARYQGEKRKVVLTLLERRAQWIYEKERGHTAEIGMSLPFDSETEKQAFEVLDRAFAHFVQERVRKVVTRIDERAQKSTHFNGHLALLCTGAQAMDEYLVYTDVALALEELSTRFNEFRFSRDTVQFKNKRELYLFSLLDPSLDFGAALTREEREQFAREFNTSGSSDPEQEEESGEAGIAGVTGGEETKPKENRYALGTVAAGADADEPKAEDPSKKFTPRNPEIVIKKADQLQKNIKQTMIAAEKTLKILHKNKKKAGEHLDEHINNWTVNSQILAEALQTTDYWKRAATLVARWKANPRIAPGTFLTMAPAAFNFGENSEDYVHFVELVGSIAPNGVWLPDNHPAMQEFNKYLDDEMAKIDEKIEDWKEKMLSVLDEAEQIEKHFKAKDSNGFGFKWYSINHVITAFTDVIDSYKKAWSQWSTLRTSEIANAVGNSLKGLPFGDQAKMTLEMELDHKNDEIKDNFKKHLEHDLATFDHCCLDLPGHPPSLLERNASDPNKFRAVLEYMANKGGWLYDMDVLKGTAFNRTIKNKLPSTWLEERKIQYIRDLHQQNSRGEKSAKDEGKSRVDTYPDIPPMIEIMEDEMKRRNYWAVFGIVERAIEKGKTGETSAWLCTVIMSYLKEDPIAREYFPKGLMDQLGNIGIQSPVWLTTFFKLDRHDLRNYQKKRLDFEEAGTLAKVITDIEKDIQSAQEEAKLPRITSKHRLNRLVAKVMASQTIREPGWTRPISIYKDNYVVYRNTISTTKTSIKPNDADDDFYNAYNNDGSEVQLLGSDGYMTICASNTTGDLINDVKAKFFLEQLVHRYDDLNKPGLERELANYLRETQQKMRSVAVGVWVHGNNNKLPDVNFRGDNSRKLILELMSRKIITVAAVTDSILKKYAFGPAAWKAAKEAGLPEYQGAMPTPTP